MDTRAADQGPKAAVEHCYTTGNILSVDKTVSGNIFPKSELSV